MIKRERMCTKNSKSPSQGHILIGEYYNLCKEVFQKSRKQKLKELS